MDFARCSSSASWAPGLSTIGLALASTPVTVLVTLVVQGTLSIVFFPAGLAAISMLTLLPERSMAIAFILFFGVTFGNGLAPSSWV